MIEKNLYTINLGLNMFWIFDKPKKNWILNKFFFTLCL